jgi:translation elongation factor EF-Ts
MRTLQIAHQQSTRTQTAKLDIEEAIKILKAEGAILASKQTDKGARGGC